MIDFTFTEEQEMLRKSARECAETMIASKIPEMEETGEVSDTPEDELENDFVLDEAARVLGDLIELMRRGATVS